MNPWQLAQQLKAELQAVTWPGGGQEVVFGSQEGVVAVLAGTPTQEQFPPAFPCALVLMGGAITDDEEVTSLRQTFRIVIGVESYGDYQGELAVIGGSMAGVGDSEERGIGEVMERAYSAVADLTGADGAHVLVRSQTIDRPFLVGSLRRMVFAELVVEAVCTSQLYYSAPQEIAYTGAPGHTWTWEGAHCSDRYDFIRYKLIQKGGSSPPTSVTDGVELYSGTAATTAIVVVSGQTVGCFAQYGSRDQTDADANVEGTSDAAVVGSYYTVP